MRRWLPALLWMGMIFSASSNTFSSEHTSRVIEPFFRWLFPSVSMETIDEIHFLVRKTGHVTEYAVLGVLFWWACACSQRGGASEPGRNWRKLGAALLLATLYAASDEFHQRFVPTRSASGWDVLVDACGAALGLAAVLVFTSLRARKASR